MTIKEINDYLMKLQVYNIKVKTVHWSTKSYATHILCDEVSNYLNDNIDKIAEICFGILNQPSIEEFNLSTSVKNIKTLSELLDEIKKITENIRKEFNKDQKYIGVLNVLDEFLSNINKSIYKLNFD